MTYSMGIDIGTTSISVTILDDEGRTIDSVTHNNRSFMTSQYSWESIQDPRIILKDTEQIVTRLENNTPDSAHWFYRADARHPFTWTRKEELLALSIPGRISAEIKNQPGRKLCRIPQPDNRTPISYRIWLRYPLLQSGKQAGAGKCRYILQYL